MSSNSQDMIDRLVVFIQQTFQQQRKTQAIIAVSGGIDSAVSLGLTVKALGVNNVHPLFLPYGDLSQSSTKDAQAVCDAFQIPESQREIVDIQPIVDQVVATDSKMDVVRRGNCMARSRMIIVFDRAKKLDGLVVGTENKTEHYLGYYTRFGDEASDLEPLRTIYKTEVRELGKALGVPEQLIKKAPSAGLWEGQTDEKEFGFTYQEVDQVLTMMLDEKQSTEVIKHAVDPQKVDKIVLRMQSNTFKHNVPFLL